MQFLILLLCFLKIIDGLKMKRYSTDIYFSSVYPPYEIPNWVYKNVFEDNKIKSLSYYKKKEINKSPATTVVDINDILSDEGEVSWES